MRPVLFDASIYITALRAGDDAVLTLRRLAPEAPVWLSAVVLEELFAGVSLRDRRAVERWSVTSTGPDASWCPISMTGRKLAKCWPDWLPSTATRESDKPA